MPKHVLSPEAAEDLQGIYDYIAADNPAAARKVLQHIRDVFRSLSLHPQIGRDRDELYEGLRSFPVSRYVIFYRSRAERVVILRVLHSARDIDEIFS